MKATVQLLCKTRFFYLHRDLTLNSSAYKDIDAGSIVEADVEMGQYLCRLGDLGARVWASDVKLIANERISPELIDGKEF